MPAGSVLLTMDDVLALKQERDEVAREHIVLTHRLEVLNAKLEAIQVLLPAHLREEIAQDEGTVRKRKWAPIIFQVLNDAGHALTTAEIAARIREMPGSPDPGFENNALYNGISKMVRKGDLLKSDGYYLLPGQKVPTATETAKPDQLQVDILTAIKDTPLKSGDIIKKIFEMKAPSAVAMTKSTGRFYKVLSHLVRIGVVQRDGHFYAVEPKTNEPSGGDTPNGSDAGSDDGGRWKALRLV